MNLIARLSVGLLTMSVCATASADWTMEYEELIGAMEAELTVCADLVPENVKKGQLLMQQKLTVKQWEKIPCIRKTDIYKKAFKEEFDLLMSLKVERRRHDCQHGW